MFTHRLLQWTASLSVLTMIAGCGTTAGLSDSGNNPGQVSSVVDGPNGKYQLVASESTEDPTQWDFAVQSATASDPFVFQWDFGDGNVYTGPEQRYTYSSDGTHTILVNALSSSGTTAFTLGLTIEVATGRNGAPVAHAGADQIVEESEEVSLYAGQSTDPDRESLTFAWSQVSGIPVELHNASATIPAFAAPEVTADTQLVFLVEVSDGKNTSKDNCVVLVKDVVDAGPIARAGLDRTVVEGQTVILDGRGSSGTITTSFWRQVAGPTVPLATLQGGAIAGFQSPRIVTGLSLELMFELSVSDGTRTSTDQVRAVINSDGQIEADARCNSDADGDRIVDCSDGCANDNKKGTPGRCGCNKNDADADSDGVADCSDECPVDPNKSVAGECGCGVSEDDPACGACLVSGTNWQNTALPAQYNSFEFQFAATPSAQNIDAIVGLSDGPGANFADFAVAVRFSDTGYIDVRNGSGYMKNASVAYIAGATYLFRVLVDVAAGLSTVYVEPLDGPEVMIAQNYAFRTEQAATQELDHWGVWSQSAGELDVCDASVAGLPLTAEAGDPKTIAPGASTVLGGRAIGGVPPYRFAWSPTTGLSSASVAQPSASPTVTTTYTLTVSDSLNVSASDTVTVTVQAVPLTAHAGADKSINAGGSTALAASASGGVPPYTYSWSPSTGLSGSTTATPTAAPSATTTYTVTVQDAADGTASDSVVVTVGGSTTGRTFYVAKDGSDSNPGSPEQPWRTLGKATSAAMPGDTVYVRAGTYNEPLRAARSGAAGSLITFKAAPGHECTHSGSYWNTPVCEVVISGANIDINRQSYIRVEGFAVTNYGGPGVWCQDRSTQVVHHVELVNNYIHDLSGYGIECRNAIDTLIEGNYIRDIHGAAGIGFRGDRPPKNVIVRGNTVLHVDCDGVHIEGQEIVIENNILGDSYHTSCHQDALEVYGPVDGLVIRNNLMWDWTQNVYLSAETNYIRNTAVLGNVVWCDRYCAQGSDAPGVNCGPNVADITNLRIEGNTFHNVWNLITDSYARSSDYWITGLVIRNNLFANSRYSVEVRNSFVSDYNLFHNTRIRGYSTLAGYRAAGGSGEANSFEADPRFLNAAAFDFHIRTDSPAIDRGTMIQDLRFDPDGKTRFQGAAFDIGAYEAR